MTRTTLVPWASTSREQPAIHRHARRIGKSTGPLRSAARLWMAVAPALRPEYKVGAVLRRPMGIGCSNSAASPAVPACERPSIVRTPYRYPTCGHPPQASCGVPAPGAKRTSVDASVIDQCRRPSQGHQASVRTDFGSGRRKVLVPRHAKLLSSGRRA